jgi:hypothetical protein
VGVDAQETLAQSDKDRDVKDGIRGQPMRLNSVNKKKTPEKFMDRNG